jgi:hypothetical protein
LRKKIHHVFSQPAKTRALAREKCVKKGEKRVKNKRKPRKPRNLQRMTNSTFQHHEDQQLATLHAPNATLRREKGEKSRPFPPHEHPPRQLARDPRLSAIAVQSLTSFFTRTQIVPGEKNLSGPRRSQAERGGTRQRSTPQDGSRWQYARSLPLQRFNVSTTSIVKELGGANTPGLFPPYL